MADRRRLWSQAFAVQKYTALVATNTWKTARFCSCLNSCVPGQVGHCIVLCWSVTLRRRVTTYSESTTVTQYLQGSIVVLKIPFRFAQCNSANLCQKVFMPNFVDPKLELRLSRLNWSQQYLRKPRTPSNIEQRVSSICTGAASPQIFSLQKQFSHRFSQKAREKRFVHKEATGG